MFLSEKSNSEEKMLPQTEEDNKQINQCCG